MRFYEYVIKDAQGTHWKFDSALHNSMRECMSAVESTLFGRFSGGEIVAIRRKFKGKEKHAPIPQDHKPREIGAAR